MTAHEPEAWTDRQLERALRELPLPTARPEFERRIRDTFVPGPGPRRAVPTPAAGTPLEAPVPGRLARLPWERLRRWGLVAAGLLGVLLVWRARFETPTANAIEQWALAAPSQDADVSVNGSVLRIPAAIRELRLEGVETVDSGDSLVQMRYGRQLLVECPAGTRVDVLHVPPPGEREPRMLLALREGTARVVTGPEFSGHELWIETQDARIQVTGTQFAVEMRPEGTCVCCREGTVRVHPRQGEGPAVEIVPGSQHLILRADGTIEREQVLPRHRKPLERLATYWR